MTRATSSTASSTGARGRSRGPEDYVNHSLYFEAKTFLHGLLVIEDKLSMAHRLETRLPFLDNDLVEFAQRVPVGSSSATWPRSCVWTRTSQGRRPSASSSARATASCCLRERWSRYIPEELTKAEKQGFSAPDASWFRGESIDYVRRTLIDGDAAIYEFLDRDVVRELVGEHLGRPAPTGGC